MSFQKLKNQIELYELSVVVVVVGLKEKNATKKNKSVAFQHIQKNSPTPAFFFKFTLFTSTPNTSYYY